MPAGGGRGWTRRGGGGARRAVLRHYKLLIRAAEPQPKNVLEARRAKENSPGREPWVRIANSPAPARGERITRLQFFRPVPGLACLSRGSQRLRAGLVSDAPPGLGLRQNRRAAKNSKGDNAQLGAARLAPASLPAYVGIVWVNVLNSYFSRTRRPSR